MIKNIKRVGIIFLAVAIVCLMTIGCLSVNSVTSNSSNFGILSSEKSNSTNSNLNIGNANGNYNVDTSTYEIPQADVVKYLQHKEDCSDSTTCTCLQDAWSDVYNVAKSGSHVKAVLMADWIARLSNEQTMQYDFGAGDGFYGGTITIPTSAIITFDINGHIIDRASNVTNEESNFTERGCISVSGTLYLMDSKYNSEKVQEAYNLNKEADLENVAISNGAGKITGNNCNHGGAVFVSMSGKLNMYGGVLAGSTSKIAGGAIYANLDANVNIYDGLLTNNYSNIGGGIGCKAVNTVNINVYGGYIYNNSAYDGGGIATNGTISATNNGCTINVFGGTIAKNTAKHTGGGINVYETEKDRKHILNVYDGIIENNNAYDAGAIFVGGHNSDVNISGGKIINNTAKNWAGGLYVQLNSTLNLYAGEISGNASNVMGGGIVVTNHTVLNIYGGKVNNNRINNNIANSAYGGGIFCNNSELYMYGGEISDNKKSRCGGGIAFQSNAKGVMYGGRISDNVSDVNSAGVLVYNDSTFDMYGGIIENNTLYREIVQSNEPNRSDAGAGVGAQTNSVFTMYGGRIVNNKVINTLNANIDGGGVFANNGSKIILNGGEITGNTMETQNTLAKGAGIYVENINHLSIGGPVHIYGNQLKDKENTSFIDSDVYLQKNSKIQIKGELNKLDNLAKIGVFLANDYVADSEFTFGFSLYNNNLALTLPMYIASNKGSNQVAVLKESANLLREVAFEEHPDIEPIEFNWEIIDDKGTAIPVKNDYTIEYSGKPFTIKLYKNGEEQSYLLNDGHITGTALTATNVGKYTYVASERDEITTTFSATFALTILPKEVDVIWNNTNMKYSGGAQKPTAYILEDSTCKVTVIGEQVNSGIYYATAMELSNANYKISSVSKSQQFTISKVKLNKLNASGTFEYTGSDIEFIPEGFDSSIMKITNNINQAVGKYNATISILDKRNYEWADGTHSDILVPYVINVVPPVNEENGVYRFIYYDEADGTRKTYKEGGLVHGINDSEVNGGKAILGNISPNTSVKVFIENLGFDANNIQLFAGNKLVYDKTNGYILNDNNYDNGAELAVGTGWYINYTAVNGEVETIYLSVLGDITGDGKVNSADVNYLRQIVNNNRFESLSEEQKLSALIVNKGKEPTSTDVQILWEAVCGRIDINEFI